MYKDILVHIDASPQCIHRLDVAVALAHRFGGSLKAVFAQQDHDNASIVARRRSDTLQHAAKVAKELVTARAAAEKLETVWLETSSGHPDDLVREMVVATRFSDVAVVSQPDSEHGLSPVPNSLVEDLVRYSGRPVLIVPGVGWRGTLATQVLVAWNASREAARVLEAALPLLRDSRNVVVISQRPVDGAVGHVDHWPGIVEHLQCHGVNASKADLAADDIGVMDLLLSQAADHGSDLIVMGAHGEHDSLFARRSVGTRFILRHMTVPILMAH